MTTLERITPSVNLVDNRACPLLDECLALLATVEIKIGQDKPMLRYG